MKSNKTLILITIVLAVLAFIFKDGWLFVGPICGFWVGYAIAQSKETSINENWEPSTKYMDYKKDDKN